ncbi:hypothetical protein GCM10009554_62520 [Kribbella koreensis]|uniref:Uncharacterized protein n=1 Tax=Kribbella koreensis TaxID=57909 RepID=A0ABP4BXH1_9ACTN
MNIAGTAQMYSQIAGVLAGFAFTALLGFLRHGASGDDGEGGVAASHTLRSVTVVLFSTITGLIISAVMYGVLAGGGEASGNSFSAVAINGPAFSLAILAMFYAVGLAATPYSHMDAMLSAVRVVVGIIGPAISLLLVATAVLDIYHFRCNFGTIQSTCNEAAQFSPDRPFGFGLLLTTLGIAGSLALWLWFRKPPTVIPAWIPTVASFMIFGASVFSVIGGVALTSLPAEYVLPDSLLYVLLVIVFLLLYTISTLAMWSCHPVSATGGGGETTSVARKDAYRAVIAPTGGDDSAGGDDLRVGMARVTRKELAARYGGYLANHYLGLHVTVVSVALGVAGLVAAGLLAGMKEPSGLAWLYWLLWFTSLLAVATAYAGTMTGAVALPSRVPTLSDLATPLLMAVVEVLMFGVLVAQIAGFDAPRVVLMAWFFLTGLFGILAVVAIIRARNLFHPDAYAPDLLGTVFAYRKRLLGDIIGAGVLSLVATVGGLVQLLRGEASVTVAFFFAGALAAELGAALVGHNQTSKLWRDGLAASAP